MAGKRESRRHSTKSFNKNIVVAEICYQVLEVLSLCDGERASIKITVLTFLLKKSTMTLSEVHSFWGVAETIAGSLLCCGEGIRDLKIQRRDGNENVLKTILLIGKTTTLHVHQASFLHISLPFLQDYDVTMPNFVFHGEDKQATRKFYFAF